MVTSITTRPVSPTISILTEDHLQLMECDLVGSSQLLLLQKNDLRLKDEDFSSNNFQEHFALLEQKMEERLTSLDLLLSPEKRQELPSFHFCDQLKLESLSALCYYNLSIIKDNTSNHFHRFAQVINLGIIEFFGLVPNIPSGSKSRLLSVKTAAIERLEEYSQQIIDTQSKNSEPNSTNDQLARTLVNLNPQLRGIQKLLEFCETAEKLCTNAEQKEGPEWEVKWEAFWASDLGKYLAISYMIEIFKREHQCFLQDPQKPLRRWLHTVALDWIEQLLLTISFPGIVEEIYAAIERELEHCQTDTTASSHQDALKTLHLRASLCFKNYFISLWTKYLALLIQSYPERPQEKEFNLLESELLCSIDTPKIRQAIENFIPNLDKTDSFKQINSPKLDAIWRKKPSVPQQLQKLVNESYDTAWTCRNYSTKHQQSLAGLFSMVSGIPVLDLKNTRSPQRPETIQSIRKSLAFMSTPGLVASYFKQLEKPQSSLHLQARAEELSSRKLSNKDVDTSQLAITTMKSLHDKIAQTNLTHKTTLSQALHNGIESKLKNASDTDLMDFIALVEPTSPNGWAPLVLMAQSRLFLSKCKLYFDHLKNPASSLTNSIESSLEKQCKTFSPPEKALDPLLNSFSTEELQDLYLKIYRRTTLSEKSKAFLLKSLESFLQKKIEKMDLSKTQTLIATLKTANIQEALGESAKQHLDQLLQKTSTAELLKAYLVYLSESQIADTELLSFFEQNLQAKNDLAAVISQSPDKSSFKKIPLEQLIALLDTFEKVKEPAPNVRLLVEELIVAKIWGLTQQDLSKQVSSSSSFVRKIADKRSRSLAPTKEESDPLVLAIAGRRTQVQTLPPDSLKEALSSLQHLRLFASCTSPCIQDRLKALDILEKISKEPPLDPQMETAAKTQITRKKKQPQKPTTSTATQQKALSKKASLKKEASNTQPALAELSELQKWLQNKPSEKEIIRKIWESSRTTLQEWQKEPCSESTQKHLRRRLALLDRIGLYYSAADPTFGEIAALLGGLKEDEMPTAIDYVKADKLLKLQADYFSLSDLEELYKNCTRNTHHPFTPKLCIYIEELFWRKIENLSLEALQKLAPKHEKLKSILEARQLMDQTLPKLLSDFYPHALALALLPDLPEHATKRQELIGNLHVVRPQLKETKERLKEQISFLETFSQKTSFLEKRITACRLALDPPVLPAIPAKEPSSKIKSPTPKKPSPEQQSSSSPTVPQQPSLEVIDIPPTASTQPPSSNPKNTASEDLPLYFLEQLKSSAPTPSYRQTLEGCDTTPTQLAQYCLPLFKECSFMDFDRLILANQNNPLLIECLFELLWEKLATMKPEDIIDYAKQTENVAEPIQQFYMAYHYAGLANVRVSDQDIQSEQDPFILALAITMQHSKPGKILNTSLEALLKQKKADLPNYERTLKTLSGSLQVLLQKRRKAYELICTTIRSLK